MTTQTEALRLAEDLNSTCPDQDTEWRAATELLRQHTRIAELEAQLEAIGAGGVSGPLVGKPQAMPDLSALTERGAKAWAGVDAQGLREGFTAADMATAAARGLRDGGASPSANAGEPSAHIKEPYTLAEIKAKIASNDYSAEMLLQHAMLLLDSASLSANAGEPRNAIDEVIRLQTQAKQDEALIRQLVDALGVATTPLVKDRQEVLRAISAGRARLDGKL